jgi:hypothetical protein
VQFVSVPEVGVPKTGVTKVGLAKVGLVANTLLPEPVLVTDTKFLEAFVATALDAERELIVAVALIIAASPDASPKIVVPDTPKSAVSIA